MGGSDNLNTTIEHFSKLAIAENNGLQDQLQKVVLCGIPLVVRATAAMDVPEECRASVPPVSG
jgi:hypothetical protein